MPDTPQLDPLVWLIVWTLATVRVTGFVVADTIFDAPRDALTAAADRHRLTRWFGYLINCAWCAGVWAAAAVTAAAWAWHGAAAFDWIMMGLAIAQVAGMLSGIGRD